MIVIGAGRIGDSLATRARARGAPVALIDRASGWEALAGPAGTPILLAVRNDDLVGVLPRIPSARRCDLVFLQNGALRDFLRGQALAHATRGVLYVWVSERGGAITGGVPSVFCGDHAASVVRWFGVLGLEAQSLDWARFSVVEFEKILWLSCFGLLCARHGATVGEVVDAHHDELLALVTELLPIGRATFGVEVPAGWLTERLERWSRAIPSCRASVKELPWRNGWLRDRASRYQLSTPLHDALLAASVRG